MFFSAGERGAEKDIFIKTTNNNDRPVKILSGAILLGTYINAKRTPPYLAWMAEYPRRVGVKRLFLDIPTIKIFFHLLRITIGTIRDKLYFIIF